ncbi:MAG: FhaA domain-containing protein [Solirubrobacteraceae bacterium]
MSVLRSLESKIADLVEGTFSRVFRSEVRPVELARKLAREMDEHKSYSVSRTYVPNEYRVYLSARDRAQFEGYEEGLADELAAYLLEHARRERLALVARPVIEFETDARLGVGQFGIQTGAVNPEREGNPVPRQDGQTIVYGGAAEPPPPPPTSAGKRRAMLLVGGRRMLVGPTGATLGRSRQCDIVVDDANVSRQHAEVRPSGASWVLVDLGSTNGSVLNGRRIDRPQELEPGDTIEVGTSVITFDVE